jgi:hypothetical protein
VSLYNMLFGQNPLSSLVLQALGTTEYAVPRFRDAYYDAEADRLVIHTRTGGGNRNYYECEARCREEFPERFEDDDPPTGPWNSDLRALPGFEYDADDDFDCTYADWFYRVPDAFRPIFAELRAVGAGQDATPAERWQTLLDGLRSGEQTPETQRALAVGEQVLGRITEAMSATPRVAGSADPSRQAQDGS